MNRLTLPRRMRLNKPGQFKAVLAHRSGCGNGRLRLHEAPNGLGYPRLGVSVPKRCGSAVVRNRLKRLAREAFRLEQHNLPADRDYVLIFTAKWSKKCVSGLCLDARQLDLETVRGWVRTLHQRLERRAAKRTNGPGGRKPRHEAGA